MAATEEKAKAKRRTTGLKLDLASGQRPTEGFQSVDYVGDPDYKVDLFSYPWPFKDRSVREVVCNHFVEHIPHWRPGYDRDGFWMFFNELYRICQKGAKVVITCPYAKSDRAVWDPSHTRGIHEMNFYYLSPAWLEAQGLQHYPVTANFEVVVIDGMGVPDAIMNRNPEMQAEARSYFWNSVTDLRIELKAIK